MVTYAGSPEYGWTSHPGHTVVAHPTSVDHVVYTFGVALAAGERFYYKRDGVLNWTQGASAGATEVVFARPATTSHYSVCRTTGNSQPTATTPLYDLYLVGVGQTMADPSDPPPAAPVARPPRGPRVFPQKSQQTSARRGPGSYY